MPPRSRSAGALALGLVLALGVAGCGEGSSADTTAVSTTEHNDADVRFASEMVQHHAQALSMVDLTLGRDLSPEVATLAEDIRGAQAPEIETMTDWLDVVGRADPGDLPRPRERRSRRRGRSSRSTTATCRG